MSDHNNFGHNYNDIVQPTQQIEQVALSDISPQDKPWDKHRKNAEIISSYYKKGGMDRYAKRVDLCSRNLDFRLVDDKHRGCQKLKLFKAQFCRVRHCPICQWRRSLMWKAKAYEALPKVVTDYPQYRWLFLTLTLKNCELTDLRDTLNDINRAFKRLTELKVFPATGWVKSIEVTRGRDGQSAHPHIHCLLLVKPDYFAQGYLHKKDWIVLWQQCLRLNYKPILDIQAIHADKSPVGLIAEILKYQCKESDLCADADWFIEYVRQMHKTRAVSVGGVLRGYFKALEEEPEDLIGKDDESEKADDDDTVMTFRWNTRIKKYILVRITSCNTRNIQYKDTA
ncbi:protein rep [Chroococcus sp. FPU101]|uniref:protein rep n=1 Tax=Chroococcus sp. FPU101 TaxID=1974212 RepID=UPI001A8BF518|nr:protein rep [Chroococcus sp. FPU101]GFE72304.1 replication protein A [Chroococcus sp. FPU101]